MMKLSMGFICSQLPYKTEIINEKQWIKYSGISIGSPSSCFKEDTIYLFLSGETATSCRRDGLDWQGGTGNGYAGDLGPGDGGSDTGI